MTDDGKKQCPSCLKWLPFFLTKLCGSCTYRRAQATAREKRERELARERSQDRSGTVGCEGDVQRALDAFDAFSRAVREAAGVPAGGSR